MCFNNSLHQTAAAVRLSPVCIKPVSELQIQFKSDSSAAAVRLSPELSGLNKESSESTVSELPVTVVTQDKEIDYFEMAAVRLSPVTTLVNNSKPPVRPPINKFKRALKLTVPQIVFRERPPRKPPDNNHNKQDGI